MDTYDMDLLNTAVESASPAELTLLLYDGAIRYTNDALIHLNEEKFDLADEDIVKVGNIIHEFQVTLDHQYKIAKPLNDLYQYMYNRLCQALTEDDERKPIISEIRELLRDFRDTWKKAMELAAV